MNTNLTGTCLLGAFLLSACATAPTVQPQVAGLVASGRPGKALGVLAEHPRGYGNNNELLYLLDKGLVLHRAGRYAESVEAFAEAERRYDELYTRSLARGAAGWLWNDYLKPYHGEDFEAVMINVFQALNYAARGDIEDALVETRDVDSRLNAINRQYPPQQKNVYREDAFARFIAGILYEASGSPADRNDALVAYKKALAIYESDYLSHYKLSAPRLLLENLLALEQFLFPDEYPGYRERYPDVSFVPWEEKAGKAEVYVIVYHGLSPQKLPAEIVLPLPGGYLSRFAFPRYKKRVYDSVSHVLEAEDRQGRAAVCEPETAEDIAAIAIKNLEDRRVRTIAYGLARPAGKYLLERGIERSLKRQEGETASRLFRYPASFYNIYSEQADLRSWLTLPAEIHIGRFMLNPDTYTIKLNGEVLGRWALRPGEKRFLLVPNNPNF